MDGRHNRVLKLLGPSLRVDASVLFMSVVLSTLCIAQCCHHVHKVRVVHVYCGVTRRNQLHAQDQARNKPQIFVCHQNFQITNFLASHADVLRLVTCFSLAWSFEQHMKNQ